MKLAMTAFHSNLKPSVGLDQGNEFANLYTAQSTLGSGGVGLA